MGKHDYPTASCQMSLKQVEPEKSGGSGHDYCHTADTRFLFWSVPADRGTIRSARAISQQPHEPRPLISTIG
ncbi:hypothetical protein [Kibdelosporangium aridum]|uniref:hypothetical protein n=1 Tax=Kibdelosporangium aridum TaxID=2030 RepID=UPI00163CF31D|nr:hypothetical protein [Kibdelosporangium aridum]